MAVTVRIPGPLRPLAGNRSTMETEARTVRAAVDALGGVRDRIVDEQGVLRRHVNVFVNGENVRSLQGLDTGVKDGDEVSIIPAVSGGC